MKCLKIICFLLLLPSSVYAADKGCGIDTDRNGTVDNFCPDPDKDFDLYPIFGYTGPYGTPIDCDDTDFFDYPGAKTTKGCSAGQYKTCQNDGTYTACSAISSMPCPTGNTYWMSAAAANCSSYTYASPANWFCTSDPGLSGYHAPVAGDCLRFKVGSYTGNWSDAGTLRQIFMNNKDGTLANPITYEGEPTDHTTGNMAKFNGTSSSPTEVDVVTIFSSDYVIFQDIEVDGTGDYSTTGVHIGGAALNPIVRRNYIHNINGESNNNLAAIKYRVNTVNGTIDHNLLVDNYEVVSPSDQNSGAITIMDDQGTVTIWANSSSNAVAVGYGFRIKHPDDLCIPHIQYNFIANVFEYGIQSADKLTLANNNWITDCTAYAIRYGDIGDTDAQYGEALFNNNTVQRCAFLNAAVSWQGSVHQAYYGAFVFHAEDNIIVDDNPSYDGDEGDGFTRICEYNCANGEFAAGAGKFLLDTNVYWNTATSTLRFGYFGQSGVGGADYASFGAWQASVLGPFDVNTVQLNPSLDADGISATYPDKGWRGGVFTELAGARWGLLSNRLTRGFRH